MHGAFPCRDLRQLISFECSVQRADSTSLESLLLSAEVQGTTSKIAAIPFRSFRYLLWPATTTTVSVKRVADVLPKECRM